MCGAFGRTWSRHCVSRLIRVSAVRVLLVPILITCLVACADRSRNLVYVDTASTDIATYAEVYNRSQDRYFVVVRYVDGPAERLVHGESDADLLVGPALTSGELAGKLRPLDRLFRSERLDEASFFPSLLSTGQDTGTQTTLPLSFRIPVVVLRNNAEVLRSFAVSPEDLGEIKESYLLWESKIVYQSALVYGARFHLLPDGRIELNQDAIERAVHQARKILDAGRSSNFSVSLDIGRPLVRSLLDERIGFFLTDLQGFLEIPQEQRSHLAIRWFGDEELIQPEEGLIHVAIRSGARNLHGAQSFLLWLFDPTTQASLLEVSGDENSSNFGIAGGIPALIHVAQVGMPRRYPFLIGLIPRAVDLAAPPVLSVDWKLLKEEVILPWLRVALKGLDRVSLTQEINDWRERRLIDKEDNER